MRKYKGVLLTTVLAAAAAHSPALAQSAGDTDAQRAEAATVADRDIIVTARRREESLQSVPIAVTAISGGELQRRNVTQVNDLVGSVPSLQIQPATSQRQSGAVTIRGQGQAYAGVLPSVITYLADVPLDPNGGAAFSTLDLENVQVLRGPQGTLFGRNTTGGAVLFVPKAPGDEFSGDFFVSTGNYGLLDLRAAVTLPISETLSVRIAAQSVDRKGFTKNLFNDKALDDQNFQVGRVFVRWKPSDRIQNDLIVSVLRADENGMGEVLTELFNNGRSGFTYQNGALQAELRAQQARGPRAVNSTDAIGARRRLFFLADTLSLELSDNVRLKNIFSYQHNKICFGTDLDGTPVSYSYSSCFPNAASRTLGVPINDIVDLNQFTDELQLSGTSFDGRLDWIVGGFFFKSYTPGGLGTFRFNRVGKTGTNVNAESAQTRDMSKALYTQATFALLDNLKATAGFRYTWDSRAISNGLMNSRDDGLTFQCRAISLPGQVHALTDPMSTCYTRFEGNFSDYGYTLGLDWQVRPGTLIYLASRRGYKSGGFNTVNAITLTSFGPETATDYEFGIKTDWSAGPVSGRINADVFYAKFGNIQRNYNLLINGAVTTVILSAARADMKGIEVEGSMNIGNHFQLTGFYSYLDPSYKAGSYTQPTTGQDISKSRFQAVAKNSGSVTARVYSRLEDDSEISLSGMLYAQSSVAFTSDTINNPTAIAPGYSTINANLSWQRLLDGKLDLNLFVRNLTNKTYVVGGLGLQATLGITTAIYGEPRMYGVSAAFHF